MKRILGKTMDRRGFLGEASCAGLGYLTFMNTLLNLKAINASAISNSNVGGDVNDYKAIVCILLAGGNDSFNMLMPYNTSHYNEYVAARQGLFVDSNAPAGLAIDKAAQYDGNNNLVVGTGLNLGHLNGYSQGARQWAVHPRMDRVKGLFQDGRLAFLSNIGTLTNPTTKSQYDLKQGLPIGLYSHSDQIQQWQTGIPNERGAKGWAGKMADMIGDCNANQNISMNVSLSGSNIFQTGNTTIEYAIDPYQGAVGIDGYNPDPMYLVENIRKEALDSMMGGHYQDIFKKTYMDVVRDAHDGFLEFDAALQNSIMFQANEFPDTSIGMSLEMIARTIDVRNTLGFDRQVFFITVGGWDHHDEVMNNQHAMLNMVSEALGSFQDAMGPSKVDMEDNVVTMMISEFGRTLNSNGNGSDHAWGGNTLVMGGPNLMNGGQIYGDYPSLAQGGPQEVGLGRFIPTLSTDEYFAEVAKWFGVPDSELTTLFPNLGNFYDPFSSAPPIGFLNL